MTYAPVLVTVYDRLEHLKRCVESLKKNSEAVHTDLYIASDYWGREDDEQKVREVRKYISSISGFKRVIPINNQTNLGAHDSICNAINTVLLERDSIIFMEDDVIVSPFFLSYMNDGLKLYEKRIDVFGICGFTYNNLKIPSDYRYETFLWARNSPWGFATWKNRWDSLDLDLHSFNSFIKDREKKRQFKRIAPSSWDVLINDRKGLIKALDVRISFNMFMHNQVSVFPFKTLTMNTGFDGTGVNCEKNKKLQNNHLNNSLYEYPIRHDLRIEKDKRIYRAERILRTSFVNDYLRPRFR